MIAIDMLTLFLSVAFLLLALIGFVLSFALRKRAPFPAYVFQRFAFAFLILAALGLLLPWLFAQ